MAVAEVNSRMRLTWLVPDDKGGGVVSVAQALCREATRAGHNATLLLLLQPDGHASKFGGLQIQTLDAKPPYDKAPAQLITG